MSRRVGAALAVFALGLLALRTGRIVALVRAAAPADFLAVAAAIALPLVGGLVAIGRLRLPGSEPAAALPHLGRSKRLHIGVAAVVVLYAIAILAPVLAPFDPATQLDLAAGRLLPPSLAHPLGTDLYSRDLLSRLLYGARLSLWIAALAVAVAVSIGTLVGLMAGFVGGTVDALLMRGVDAALAIPRLFLLLVILGLWEHAGIATLVLVLGATGWFGTSRLVRAEVLSLKGRDFVVAARALGASRRRILLRHLLPNVAAPIIVTATLGVGNTILIETGLSFLGLGVHPPFASWGNMIADAQPFLATTPWLAVVPGVAVLGTVMVFSVLGDGLREVFDPRAS